MQSIEDNVSVDIRMGAFLLNTNFINIILGKEGMVESGRIAVNRSYENAMIKKSRWCIETRRYSPNAQIEKVLFNLSNQIGAFFLYVFIQAINPDYVLKLLRSQTKGRQEYSEEKNSLVEWWVRNAITPRLMDMLLTFRHSLEAIEYIPDTLTEGKRNRKKSGI